MNLSHRLLKGSIALATLSVALLAAGLQAKPPVVAKAVKRTSALDEPLRILGEAREAYAGVQDYACTLIKRERINGELQSDNIITMRARTTPFSVYFKWHEPKSLMGQEACYVVGRHNGKMRVKPNGFLAAVGFITLETNDARALKNSRRSITEAGIGNLIERVSLAWEAEKRLGHAQVRIGEFEYNKRRCIRVETINSGLAGEQVPCARSLIYFDKETKLPIRVECYDWPKEKGRPGDLLDVYSFINLKLNVGLGDEVFNH